MILQHVCHEIGCTKGLKTRGQERCERFGFYVYVNPLAFSRKIDACTVPWEVVDKGRISPRLLFLPPRLC